MANYKVVLVGGPAGITDEDRIRHAESLNDTIKCPRYGGYEHFRHTGDFVSLDGEPTAVFEWTTRTKIAE